ncbi:MAG: cysteine-rich CWC family protein [Burkholderiales bacterium]|nr:cysteine-rich CWC family protein [Burkholderiales bacterium]
MPAPPSVPQHLCPACGQPNACRMAAGGDARGCWCMDTPIAAAVLARLPAAERGQRCVCAACAADAGAAAPSDACSAQGRGSTL